MPLRLLFFALSVALLGFAPAPFPRAERQREDLTDVGGTWEFVSWELNGARQEAMEQTWKAELTPKLFRLAGRNNDQKQDYPMRLDPASKPAAFVWHSGESITYQGSYRLRKDHLTMVFRSGGPNAVRPTDFEREPEGYRFVMRRVKR